MKSDVKKFVTALGLSPEMTAFLLVNRLALAICNIKRGKNKSVTFNVVTDYAQVEEVTLSKEEQAVWDLFYDFKNVKNAMAVILHAIENKTDITAESFNNQSKITPKADLPKVRTYGGFWASLTDEQKVALLGIAAKWLKDKHMAKTSFEFFFVNGTKNVTLKEGDYILGYDSTYGQQMCGKVLQASPEGFVTCVDNGGHFTLGADFNPEVVAKETLPKEVVEILDATFTKLTGDTDEQKEYRLGKAMEAAKKQADFTAKVFDRITNMKITTPGLLDTAKKLAADNTFSEEETKAVNEHIAEAEKALKEGAEAAEKADKEKTATYNRLKNLKLTSEDAIAKAVGDLNAAKLGKERTNEIRDKIKAAKEALKTPKENAPEPAPAATAETAPAATQSRKRKNNAPAPAAETAPATTEAPQN